MSGGPNWISAAPLLPHQPPARLVERIALVADEEIEFEGGGEQGSRTGSVVDTDTMTYYIYLGYRADF